jgi:putative transposase
LLRSAGRFQFDIPAYCVMPDHVHVLAEATHHDGDLLRFVSHWKQLTGYHWKKRTGEKLWQKGFFDRVLRPEDEDVAVVNYIVSNPVRDGLSKRRKTTP